MNNMAANQGKLIKRLQPTAPFDFQKMLLRPLSRISKLIVIDSESSSYTRVMRLGDRPIPVTVTSEGTVMQPSLAVSYPDHLTRYELAEVHKMIERMFCTECDLMAFYRRASLDAIWAPFIEKYSGLRPICDTDLFETMVKVIIGQQLNVQFAATLIERLVDLGGEEIVWNNRLLSVFPAPEKIAGWSYEQLRALSFSQRKAEYVIDFARAVVDEKVVMERFWNMSDDRISAQLLPMRGIGRWTVECFLLFGLGRTDVMPGSDIGVQNAVQSLYGLSRRPKDEEIRGMFESFAPWRSYVTYYLWQSLIEVPQ